MQTPLTRQANTIIHERFDIKQIDNTRDIEELRDIVDMAEANATKIATDLEYSPDDFGDDTWHIRAKDALGFWKIVSKKATRKIKEIDGTKQNAMKIIAALAYKNSFYAVAKAKLDADLFQELCDLASAENDKRTLKEIESNG